jgi:hypothetical protein
MKVISIKGVKWCVHKLNGADNLEYHMTYKTNLTYLTYMVNRVKKVNFKIQLLLLKN